MSDKTLRRNVDFKIFELQSLLIFQSSEPSSSSPNKNEDKIDTTAMPLNGDALLEESLKWLHSSHFFDVIEERIHDGRCGYPLCRKNLEKVQQQYLKKKTASLESISELLGGDLPISSNANKSLERKLLFCSSACSDISYSRMESRFDTSSPYNREVVLRDMETLSTSSIITTTNNTTADVSVIDAMLSVLSSPPVLTSATISSPGKGSETRIGIAESSRIHDEVIIDDTDNSLPSAASGAGAGGGTMSLDGTLEVVFEDGLPKPIRPKTPATLTSSKPLNQAPQQPIDDRNRGFENKIKEIKQLRGELDLKPPKPARSSSKKPYPSNIAGNAKMDMPEVMYNPPTKVNDQSISKLNTIAMSNASISSATISAGVSSASKSSSYQEGNKSSMDSSSYGDTTAINNPSKKKVTFASILESMRNHPQSNSKASREDRVGSQQNQQLLKVEPLSWSEAWSKAADSSSTSLISENKKAASTQPTTASTLSSAIRKPQQPRSGSDGSSAGVDAKPTQLKSAKSAKPTKKGIDTGIVVERTPTGPMSAAAIMTKQEPDYMIEDISTSTAAGHTTAIIDDISSRSVRKKGVDEPPTAATATLAARSIEGYVQLPDGTSMAVARAGQIRVAPRTLLQGLSYNPFPTANMPKKSTKDEGDQSTDSEVEDEEDVRYPAESESNDTQPPTPMETPRDNVSLFLGLWTALDDVFPEGMLLSSMLDTYTTQCSAASTSPQPQRQPQLMATSSSKGISKASKMEGTSRPPLATETQQVYLTLTALLDRGVREAEKRLDVIPFLQRFSSCNGLDTLLRQYHLVKNCILSSSSRRMHSCPGLHQSGWATIGIIIVDAAVRHSLWADHSNATHNLAFSTSNNNNNNSSSSSSSDHSNGGGSSSKKKSESLQEEEEGVVGSVDNNKDSEAATVKDLWDRKVDITIEQALGNAAHMLRAGDIVSLKTFFR